MTALSASANDGPAPVSALPAPATTPSPPSKTRLIRFGKNITLFIRGILALAAFATIIIALIVSSKKIPVSGAVYGCAFYSLIFNILIITFIFLRFPFHPDGVVMRVLPKRLVKVLRRFPSIWLTIIDFNAVAILMFAISGQGLARVYDDRYIAGLLINCYSGLGAGHMATLFAGWAWSIITILRNCCIKRKGGRKGEKEKMEELYEKARREIKEKELEEANEVDLRTLSKKERMERKLERVKREREIVERLEREDRRKSVSAVRAEEGRAELVEAFAPVDVPAPVKVDMSKMTKKERMEVMYERARLEREAGKVEGKGKGKGKGKAKASPEEMV